MMPGLPLGLQQWAALTGPTLLLAALRHRAERGHGTDVGPLRVELTAVQRREVARLLGTQWEVAGRDVSLSLLSAVLAEHGLTVRQLLEAVGGPVVVRSEALAADRERVRAARDRAARTLADAGVAATVAKAWADDVAESDLGQVVELVAKVWRHLPAETEPARLAQLAADVLNDSHGLDATTHLGRVVARLAAAVNGLPKPGRAGAAWRAAWRSVAVECDTVSSRVLVLNLALRGPSSAAAICASAPGEPVWLTQRMLEREWTCDPVTVHVCENPTIVEAAAEALGRDCPPLVCTDGIASSATTGLIAGLAAAGCPIVARADFDEAGLTVVDQVATAAPAARLWHFDQQTYAGLVSAGKDEVAAAPGLREAIRLGGAIHEERLLGLLIDDLRSEAARGA